MRIVRGFQGARKMKNRTQKRPLPSFRIELCRERLIKPCGNQRAGSFAERRAARGSRGRFGEKRIVELGERIFCQSQAFGESRTEIRERVCNLLVSPAVEDVDRDVGEQV